MTLQSASQRALVQYVEQIEQLESERKAIADHINDKFSEARGAGFDVKIMRKVIKLRKMSPEDRAEEQALLDIYEHALDGTPMGEYLAEQSKEAA